jgi:hypothetical protein
MLLFSSSQAGRPGSVEKYRFEAVDCQNPATVLGYALPVDCQDKSAEAPTYVSQ